MTDSNIIHQGEDTHQGDQGEDVGNEWDQEGEALNAEDLLKQEIPKLSKRRKDAIDQLVKEQLRVEETIRIANQVILNKQEVFMTLSAVQ